MILDSSAVIAILRGEPEAPEFIELIAGAPVIRMSGANALECAIVLGADVDFLLDRFLDAAAAQLEPVTTTQVSLARAAHRAYGRGSGHPARLNFGDCFAYALAKDRDEPLLFKGDDFSRTDVRRAG